MGNTSLELRPYQEQALNQLRHDWKKSATHLMQAPTGAGKTALAAEIIAGCSNSGLRCMFVAPYTVLIEQTKKAFMSYGLAEPGIIWRDHPTDPGNMIQIASADTLIRRDFPDVDVVVIDEAHIRRKKLLEIMADSDAKWIALTATPYAKFLGEHWHNFIKVTTMKQLIKQGFLSDYDVFAPVKPDLKGVRSTNTAGYGQDYVESQVAEIMGEATIVGNIVQNWLQHGENRPTIAFAVNVAHANHLTVEFARAGVNAEVIIAETPHEERREIFGRFRSGLTKVLCNVGTLVAGLDEDVRCIIYARPTKSEIRWVQALGRGVRLAHGKDKCLIFDHSGTVHRLGFPCDIEYDELPSGNDGMSEQQRQAKEREKKEKLPKECPKCKRMKQPGEYQCKNCGFKPIMGEDVETDESRGLELIRGKKKKLAAQDKQSIYSQLIGYMNERELQTGKRYSDGWLSHKYKEITGVWPKGLSRNAKPPSVDVRNWIKSKNIAWAKRQQK